MRISRFSLVCLTTILLSCSGNETTDKKEIPAVEKQQQQDDEASISSDHSGDAKSNQTTASPLSKEDQLIDKVYDLPEVQELEASIRKKSGGKRNLSLRISSEPSDDQEYYGVTVAEDNGAALATYYEFHVYPGFEIRYYDVVEDQEISLDEWRKSR